MCIIPGRGWGRGGVFLPIDIKAGFQFLFHGVGFHDWIVFWLFGGSFFGLVGSLFLDVSERTPYYKLARKWTFMSDRLILGWALFPGGSCRGVLVFLEVSLRILTVGHFFDWRVSSWLSRKEFSLIFLA